MFCVQCHNPNADDNKFCSECGVRLAASTAASGSPEITELISRAFTLLEQGDLTQAHSVVDAAIALDPDNSSAHSLRSILFEREGKIAEAIRELELVVAQNPNSSTDRAKLAVLQGNVTTSFRQKRWTSQQITFASAAAAGLIVFGGGLAMISRSSSSHSETNKAQSVGLNTAGSTLSPATANAAPSGPRPLRQLPTSPVPAVGTLQGPPVPAPVQAALGKPASPIFSTPGRPGLLRPSAPIGPLGMPQMGATAGKPGAAGLPPAAIGEVVPLPQTPAVAPGGPSVAAVTPPPAAVAGGAAVPGGPAGDVAAAPAASKAAGSAEQKPRVELLEPETGFIKIEPLKAAGDSRGANSGSTKAAPPSISVNIASSGGDEAAIAEAQRAQRSAFSAARVANLEDAERHYRQAASLYELLVKRGGSSAREAREGLDACKKALAALH